MGTRVDESREMDSATRRALRKYAATTWTSIAGSIGFANAWVDFDAAHITSFRKVGDEVVLRGLIKNGVAGATIFTLPVGFRPYQEETFAVLSNGVFAFVTVNPSGIVNSSGANPYIYLSGIRFSTIA